MKLTSYIFFEKEKIRKNKKEINTKKKEFSFVETILNSMRNSNKTIHHNNIPLQQETLLLRKELFHTMALTKKFKLENNLNHKQITCIRKFFKDKPFSICNSDKNVGWVCLDKSLYIKLAKDHLFSNKQVYKEINHDPLQETLNKIISTLNCLKDRGHISNRLHKLLLPKNECKPGKFRFLAKLHKDKFGIRPIINSINHPTASLSQFIDLFLQPFVKNSESFLKDSQNLIQECKDLKINHDYFKYSCDFESLYTNINSDDAIKIISDFFKTKMDPYIIDIDIIGFNEILKLILYNNIFSFINYFFIQINGLAMGGKCGPSIANIYIYIKEKEWLYLNRANIPIYKRFIDDIFITSKYDLQNSNFKNIFGNLNLNIICDKEVQFLDLLISKHKYFNVYQFNYLFYVMFIF